MTPAEAERLVVCAEELAEAVQAISKVLRHGYDNFNPELPVDLRITNRAHLEKELAHVAAAVNLMVAKGDLHASYIAQEQREKERTVVKWLRHNDGIRG